MFFLVSIHLLWQLFFRLLNATLYSFFYLLNKRFVCKLYISLCLFPEDIVTSIFKHHTNRLLGFLPFILFSLVLALIHSLYFPIRHSHVPNLKYCHFKIVFIIYISDINYYSGFHSYCPFLKWHLCTINRLSFY